MTLSQVAPMRFAAFAVALGLGLPRMAAEIEPKTAKGVGERPAKERTAEESTDDQSAQFTLPGRGPAGTAPKPPPRRFMQYEYSRGSETKVPYRRNNDLNRSVEDDSAVAMPTVFGMVTYRPSDWLETRLEGTLERVISIREEEIVDLPNGAQLAREKKPFTLVVDQAYAKFRADPGVPTEISVGRRSVGSRRTFGGDRPLWLYEGSLDGVHTQFKPGDFVLEAGVNRKDFKELDLLNHPPRGRVTNYIFHADYRGVEDHNFSAYYVYRRDAIGEVGRPEFTGLRATGRPSDSFNYWADLARVFGSAPDQNGVDETLDGHAYQAGATYRFLNLPWYPSITAGFAYGSGDGSPNDGSNTAFRQTGLHLNEGTFGGLTVAKLYGEVFDPELSNLKIFTLGAGFRPAAGVFVDLVYHGYEMNRVAQSLRGTPITAELNQVAGKESTDVGREIDLIVGFRNVLGIRGFGFDLRLGWFLPGEAYLRDDNGVAMKPDVAASFLGVLYF